MKNLFFFTTISILLTLFFANYSFAKSYEKDFSSAIYDYKQGKYEVALNKFLEIEKQGIKNGKLYYNIGNTYFKLDKKGHSILWYEKAKKIIPSDPDLIFNLNYLHTFKKDKDEKKDSLLTNILFFWKNSLTQKDIQYISILFVSLLFIALIIKTILKKEGFKFRISILILCSFIFVSFALYDFAKEGKKKAIVLSDSIIIRSGLHTESTELFRLHSGTKVKIESEKEGFYKIIFSKNKRGWTEKRFLGII